MALTTVLKTHRHYLIIIHSSYPRAKLLGIHGKQVERVKSPVRYKVYMLMCGTFGFMPFGYQKCSMGPAHACHVQHLDVEQR